jgi:hypothetical protein
MSWVLATHGYQKSAYSDFFRPAVILPRFAARYLQRFADILETNPKKWGIDRRESAFRAGARLAKRTRFCAAAHLGVRPAAGGQELCGCSMAGTQRGKLRLVPSFLVFRV